MLFAIEVLEIDGEHRWAVLTCSCDLNNDSDSLLNHIGGRIREAYGAQNILERITADPAVAKRFDLAAIERAIYMGLPNPEREGMKPEQLTNFRSESAEVVAREALTEAHGITFPTHPQEGKTNPNQPILGFDGWGIKGSTAEGFALVLVQVKGTDEPNCPPSQAHILANECSKVPQDKELICRTLTILAGRLQGTELEVPIWTMLQSMGEDRLPSMIVAPVVVRGNTQATIGDLEPIRNARHTFQPVPAHSVSVSVGADLTDFGNLAMKKARAA